MTAWARSQLRVLIFRVMTEQVTHIQSDDWTSHTYSVVLTEKSDKSSQMAAEVKYIYIYIYIYQIHIYDLHLRFVKFDPQAHMWLDTLLNCGSFLYNLSWTFSCPLGWPTVPFPRRVLNRFSLWLPHCLLALCLAHHLFQPHLLLFGLLCCLVHNLGPICMSRVEVKREELRAVILAVQRLSDSVQRLERLLEEPGEWVVEGLGVDWEWSSREGLD